MARKAKPGDALSTGPNLKTNLSETKEIVVDAFKNIMRFKNERKEINAAIAEERARVVNCGIPKAALDLAIRMKEMDSEDRKAIDEGYAIARDALGLGMQLSMFEDQAPAKNDDEEQTGDPAEKKPTAKEALDKAKARLAVVDNTGSALN